MIQKHIRKFKKKNITQPEKISLKKPEIRKTPRQTENLLVLFPGHGAKDGKDADDKREEDGDRSSEFQPREWKPHIRPRLLARRRVLASGGGALLITTDPRKRHYKDEGRERGEGRRGQREWSKFHRHRRRNHRQSRGGFTFTPLDSGTRHRRGRKSRRGKERKVNPPI